ncbi:MAG TPA: response regulator [Solirubrobacteraceae bacterium]
MVGEQDPLRVLVVDDEPNIVDVVSMALRHNGFDVDAADSGAGALARVREWRPHVLVLDVMLPDMDGFEVAKRLTNERADVPILFLSARDATADKVRGLTTGGDDYVTKPRPARRRAGRPADQRRTAAACARPQGRTVARPRSRSRSSQQAPCLATRCGAATPCDAGWRRSLRCCSCCCLHPTRPTDSRTTSG